MFLFAICVFMGLEDIFTWLSSTRSHRTKWSCGIIWVLKVLQIFLSAITLLQSSFDHNKFDGGGGMFDNFFDLASTYLVVLTVDQTETPCFV